MQQQRCKTTNDFFFYDYFRFVWVFASKFHVHFMYTWYMGTNTVETNAIFNRRWVCIFLSNDSICE